MSGWRKVACTAVGFTVAAFFAVSAVGSAAGPVSCGVAREAILAGDPTVIHDAAEITVSLRELRGDPTAPPVARQYAHLYLMEDRASERTAVTAPLLAQYAKVIVSVCH